MLKILKNRQTLLYVSLPAFVNEVDFEKYKQARGLYIEDPWKRVKSIFSRDNYGNWHPELMYAFRMGQYGLLLGLFVGGVKESRKDLEKYFRTNDTNIYANKKHAYKALSNQMMLSTTKGGIKYALPFAIFAASFSLLSSCCELYRNKIGIIDKVFAGGSCGALYRFMFGPKGMISGCFFGSVLGGIYGVLVWGVCKLTKTNQLELKYTYLAFAEHLKEKKKTRSYYEEENKKIVSSMGYAMHIPNPLDFFEEENKMNFNEKQNT